MHIKKIQTNKIGVMRSKFVRSASAFYCVLVIVIADVLSPL